ncbi:MAG: DUF1992 domain-containing protein [Rhodocyclales bacterium]|nr:DUF1992 domain-containing protein [Rhodocyclales bacterium]
MANKLQLVEDEIGRCLRQSAESGELAQAAGYGKPLDLGDGFQETPEELRMGFKMLKDAGFVPPEVSLMNEIASIRDELAHTISAAQQGALRQHLRDLEVSLAIAKSRLSGGSIA